MYKSTNSICIVLFELSEIYIYIKCSTLILILLLNCCFTICESIYVLFLQNHFLPRLVNLLFKHALPIMFSEFTKQTCFIERVAAHKIYKEVLQIQTRLAFLRLSKR